MIHSKKGEGVRFLKDEKNKGEGEGEGGDVALLIPAGPYVTYFKRGRRAKGSA